MKAPVRVKGLVYYRKAFKVNNPRQAHQAVGWAIGAMKQFLDAEGKTLYKIKSFALEQKEETIIVGASIIRSYLTIDDDPIYWFRDVIGKQALRLIEFDGWHWNTPEPKPWDSVEIIGDITVLTGEETGLFIGRKPERTQECESA